MAFQQQVSWIPLTSLRDYLLHHRFTIVMSVAPICLGSLTVMLLHWLKCPSFDFSGGYPISTFFQDIGVMLEWFPQNLSGMSGGGVGDILVLVIMIPFLVWLVGITVKACLGIIWVTLQYCDSILGLLGQSILAPFRNELAVHRSVGVFLGSCFTSVGLLVFLLLAVLVAYRAARHRTIRKRRELMD
mmetsp:Transcript_49835/g.91255  ORF Transcript_49835/g.91255 Transcript_49835/m.91255 type:complete len:187 (+) Transcript_49835:3-563(+)